MADYEVSKIMWVAIVVALAASVFIVAKPEISALASSTLDNVGHVVQGIDTGYHNAQTGRPNPDDPKWVVKSTYGTNGTFVMDKDGSAVVFATDASKPITLNTVPAQTKGNTELKHLVYQDQVILSGDMKGFFSNDSNMETITGLDKWNTSAVTSMSEMFLNASNLTSLDLKTWDVAKVTDMSSMFRGDSELYKSSTFSGDLRNWSVTEGTNFDSMFDGASYVGNLPAWYPDITEVAI